MKNQHGFTLIELIVVIVILGILAATALPKFSNLTVDARIAKMNALAGSLRAASVMAHGQSMAEQINSASSVMLEGGIIIDMKNYYPSASGITASIDNNINGFASQINPLNGVGEWDFYPDAGRMVSPGTCVVRYFASSGVQSAILQVPLIDDSAVVNPASAVGNCS